MKRPSKREFLLNRRSRKRRGAKAEAPAMNAATLKRAASATRSGMSRYPKELYASLREGRNGAGQVISPTTDLKDFEQHDLAALWIGHATVLLRIGGMTVVTDPVFSRRIGVRIAGLTMGVARLIPPALDVDHLPKIDAVLISHAHFDHLDRPSLARLAKTAARGAVVVTAENTRRLVPREFRHVVELPWDGAFEIEGKGRGGTGLSVRAVQPRHWGARAALDRHRRFNSYVLWSAADRVFFAGDSANTDAFNGLGPMALSIFGIGAYDPWEHAHATPEQVWSMYLRMAGGRAHGPLLPMHHSTFALGREPLHEPLKRLCAAAADDADRIVGDKPGVLWTRERVTMGGAA